ncbi:MAG TPA: holo-ACP synthase [Clostridia bacterium]|nr:holo-ACP synthase [Clostridia bacterium]
MIVGMGVDVTEVARMEAAIARFGQRILQRLFTEAEIHYCESKLNKFERYAGRFAAKEAAMKAIGTGWKRGVAWRDFEVRREPSGRPTIGFSGKAAEFAHKLGVRRASISISHTEQMAIAQVILED